MRPDRPSRRARRRARRVELRPGTAAEFVAAVVLGALLFVVVAAVLFAASGMP